MNKSHITIIRKSHALRILLITILIIATLTILYSSNTAKNTPYPSPLIQPNLVTSYSASKDELQNHEDNKQEQQLVASKVNFHDVHYQVKQGDNLESIFNHQNISGNTLSEILEADEQYLDIDVLKPGEQLTFRFDNHNKLAELMFVSNPSKTILYQRHDAEHFEHKQKLIPTQWVTDVVRGTIKNSFYVSAASAGMTDKTIMNIQKLLSQKINFRRDIRNGDSFQVIVERETINGSPDGKNYVVAARINGKNVKLLGAYMHTDGVYYDKNGNNLSPALLRYPTKQHFRVSSPFNPRRLNPVTGRYASHNGVDFAMPIGTPVVSTGDGVIERVASQKYAGKYLVIDEFGPFSTRYLHLSKILVHKGQKVSRGQVIALSGNTGRSTGPHLHYELHIDDKPVNPITAKIPLLKSIPKTDFAAYKAHVHTLDDLMTGKTDVAASNLDWLDKWAMNQQQANSNT